jgi:hypothetical protein
VRASKFSTTACSIPSALHQLKNELSTMAIPEGICRAPYRYFAFHVALSSGMAVLGKTQNTCNQPSILDSFFAPLWKSKIFVFAQLL